MPEEKPKLKIHSIKTSVEKQYHLIYKQQNGEKEN